MQHGRRTNPHTSPVSYRNGFLLRNWNEHPPCNSYTTWAPKSIYFCASTDTVGGPFVHVYTVNVKRGTSRVAFTANNSRISRGSSEPVELPLAAGGWHPCRRTVSSMPDGSVVG